MVIPPFIPVGVSDGAGSLGAAEPTGPVTFDGAAGTAGETGAVGATG